MSQSQASPLDNDQLVIFVKCMWSKYTQIVAIQTGVQTYVCSKTCPCMQPVQRAQTPLMQVLSKQNYLLTASSVFCRMTFSEKRS